MRERRRKQPWWQSPESKRTAGSLSTAPRMRAQTVGWDISYLPGDSGVPHPAFLPPSQPVGQEASGPHAYTEAPS